MSSGMVSKRILVGLVVLLAPALNAAGAESAKAKFHRAYYLERAGGDWAAAAELYEEVATDRRADAELRAQAEAHLAACREELSSVDFAKLMPPDAWAYVEIARPGDQVKKLLGKLGLLAKADAILSEGQNRVAVSPKLVNELLGIRGAAVAITGFDPKKDAPSGVLVFHPGAVEVVRGLIETALPVGGQAVEPIGGFPTYDVEGEILVTVTSRLIVASTERSQIEGVVSRLSGKKKASLATNPALSEVAKNRGDSLLHFFVNAKAMMPMLKGVIAAEAANDPELAMVAALLDLDSLQSLSGRLGVDDDGVSLELALRLDEGHQNLVYNFFRTPAIDSRTLDRVPEGAAAFVAVALNEAESRYTASSAKGLGEQPVVSAWDLGREIFANITSLAVFALPPDGSPRDGGPPIPDVAAVITVNDPSKSEALWSLALGLGGLASSSGAMEGERVDIDGVAARKYRLPDGITIYFATMKDAVVIASSKSALTAAVRAGRKGNSVLGDKAFGPSLSRISQDTTRALFVHAGRCAQIAKPFMSKRDLSEAEPFMALLSDTVASFVVDHSDNVFRISTTVSGIPDIGDLVSKLVMDKMAKDQRSARLTRAMKAGRWDEALAAVEASLSEHPDSVKLLRAKFKILAVGRKDSDAALACADQIFDKVRDNPTTLNRFAWVLLTEDQYGDAYAKLALKLSKRSNELTDSKKWMFLDTLALARFTTGDAAGAVTLEQDAIERCGDCWGRDDMKKALARFEAGAADGKLAGGADSR